MCVRIYIYGPGTRLMCSNFKVQTRSRTHLAELLSAICGSGLWRTHCIADSYSCISLQFQNPYTKSRSACLYVPVFLDLNIYSSIRRIIKQAVMGSGRRWAVDFTDNSTSNSSRDIPDPPGFTRASQEQVCASLMGNILMVLLFLVLIYLFWVEWFVFGVRMIRLWANRRRMLKQIGKPR